MNTIDENLILFIDSCFEEELYYSGLEILDVVLMPKKNENLEFIPFLPEKYLRVLMNLIIQKSHENYHISQKAAQLVHRIIYSKKLYRNELNTQWFWMFSHNKRSQRSKRQDNDINTDYLDMQDNMQLNLTKSIFSKFSNIWELVQQCFNESSPYLYVFLDCIITILEMDWKEYSEQEFEKELEKTLLMNSFKNDNKEKPDIKQILTAIFNNIESEEYKCPLSSNIVELPDEKKTSSVKSIESMMLRKRFLYLIYDAVCSLPTYFNQFNFENELSIYLKNLEIDKFIFYFSNAIPPSLKINLCHLLLVKYSIHSKLSKHFSELSIDMLRLWPTIASQAKLRLPEKAKYSFLLQLMLKHVYKNHVSKKSTQEEKQAIEIAKNNRVSLFNEEIKKIREKNKITDNVLHIQNIFEHSEYFEPFLVETIN
ncbi:unnamed protein product [Pneumocystis jirovecii]|uniref:Uncharacterized protein n=1 Tax=Pneumocystis jirovecii TaxID=42068 RepID=L0PA46_PNEJI|nr:unnamed protein product [Pneumocystis jirovecii]